MATYQRWLIARGNAFSPAAASVAKLIDELRAAHFLVDPSSPDAMAKLRFEDARSAYAKKTGGYAVVSVANEFDGDETKLIEASTEALPPTPTAAWIDDPDREELRLVWPVRGAADVGLEFPLSMKPEGETSYALEVHRAPDYVYPRASSIGKLPTKCTCGDRMDFEWDPEEVIAAFPSASGIFTECDACSRTFDPSKGSAKIKNPFDGSIESMFGGAAYRFCIKVTASAFVRDPRVTFAPTLVSLVEKAFGRSFYEVAAADD